jgi:hypothetical protein
MAKLTLLQMTQAACGEMGLPSPVSVVDSNNLIAVQLLALANREAKECVRRSDGSGGWQAMRKENVFAMVPSQQSYALPADFDYIIPGTMWDRGYRWQVFGPLSPQEWQVLKSGLSPTGPRRRFRIMQGKFYFDPIPLDTNTLVYEYYSSSFGVAADGTTAKSMFTLDTDTYALPDDLLIQGMIWRWRRAKGLAYDQEYQTYEEAVQREMARDASARTLQLDLDQPYVAFLSGAQIPDTGFGA